MDLRIPPEEAFTDSRLLGEYFQLLSPAQKVALKTLYGMPLESAEEVQLYSAQQGFATYDDLGFITDVNCIPYHPQQFTEGWIVAGRRWGKTSTFAATI